MFALGIIIVLIAAGVLLAALFGGSNQPATFDLGVVEVETNTLGVFLLGAFTLLLLVVGLILMQGGLRRMNRRRQERKELTRLQKLEAQETRPAATTADTTTAETAETTRATETRSDSTVTERDRPKQ